MHTDDTPKEAAVPHPEPHRRYNAHYNSAGRVVWTVTQEPVSFTPEVSTEQPKRNHAQRRKLQQQRRRKARAELAIVKRRKPEIAEALKWRCAQCDLPYLGTARARCQCKVERRRLGEQ